MANYKDIFEEAVETARSINDDEFARTMALGGIASDLAKAGELERALEIARSIPDDESDHVSALPG